MSFKHACCRLGRKNSPEFMEITIYQSNSCTHTKFMLLPGGRVFGEENFQLAAEWYQQGLLSGTAKKLIEVILEVRAYEAKKNYQKQGMLQN